MIGDGLSISRDAAAIGGGGQITSRKAVLVGDNLVACTCGSKIRVYSSLSGEMLFEMEGHTDEVTDLCLNEGLDRVSCVYSCGKDGKLMEWDLDSGACVATWEIPGARPAESVIVLGKTAYVSFFWRGEDAGRILAFDLAEGQASEVRIKLSTPRSIVCSGHRAPIVATHDRHTVLVWDVAREGLRKKKALRMHHTKAITCVAVSPDGSRIAAGDVTGRILIWHDMKQAFETMAGKDAVKKDATSGAVGIDELKEDEGFVEYPEPPAASVHWHAHSVGCLSFSADGRYLLSGGEEAVLVLWDVKTSGRAYLPRLGGPITGITPCRDDPAKYCLRQSDNTLRIVNIASMMIECSIHGMRPAPRGGRAAPITFEGRHGHAVVVGDHSVLQFFDVSRDVHVDRLQLSRRNIVSMSGEEDHGVFVEAIAFDETASLLVSVETTGDNQLLKFWDRSPEDQRQYGTPYHLNTLSENPHRTTTGNHAITGLAMSGPMVTSASVHSFGSNQTSRTRSSASSILVATSSNSGDFVLWERHNHAAQQRDRSAATWRKMAVIPGHHGDPLTAIAFSSDSSLIAVAGDRGAISLWDTASLTFVGELPPAFVGAKPKPDQAGVNVISRAAEAHSKKTLSSIFFLPESPIAVYVCGSGIAVYDVLSLSMVWSAELEGICSVASDPSSNHWAIVIEDTNHVLLFEGDNNMPRMGWTIRRRQTSAPKPPTLNPATLGGTKELERRARAAESSAVPEIAFVPQGTVTYGAARATSVPGCSPLVVFSPDREFMSVVGEIEMGVGPRTKAARDVGAERAGGVEGTSNASGFARIFGSSATVDAHQAKTTKAPLEAAVGPEAEKGAFGDVLSSSVQSMVVDFLSYLLD